MGQIQNAITGAVSSIVGAKVAGELKNQREITSLTKDVGTVAEQVEKYKQHEATFQEQGKKITAPLRHNNQELSLEEIKKTAYNSDTFKKADEALNQEYEQIKGWKTRVQQRLDALKARGASSLDLEVAVKNANERIAMVEGRSPKVLWENMVRDVNKFEQGGNR